MTEDALDGKVFPLAILQFKQIKLQSMASQHRKNCECCPGHSLTVSHNDFSFSICQEESSVSLSH